MTLLQDDDVQSFAARPKRRPDPRRIDQAETLVQRAEEEDRAAQKTFAHLMERPIEAWAEYLAANPAQRTEGLIRRLITEARTEYDRRADYALELLSVAASIANALTDPVAIADQRGTIAKERANALRMLSRYQEALDELDWAERFLVHLPVNVFDLAVVEWARATVLFYMTRYGEALPLVRHAAKILRQFGDIPRAQQVRLLEAGILYEMGDTETALGIYEGLVDYFDRSGDFETLARVFGDIATCEMRLSRVGASRINAARAVELYDRVGKPTEKARVQWMLAHLLMLQGQFDDALHDLAIAADSFEMLGMIAERGTALLDIVEIHVARQAWDEAIRLSQYLAGLFTTIRAPVRAARAYSYLREAIESRSATTQLIEYIRSYVTDEMADDRAFTPPS
jgi:tetratricopeptide (TPR) repeat protein